MDDKAILEKMVELYKRHNLDAPRWGQSYKTGYYDGYADAMLVIASMLGIGEEFITKTSDKKK